MGTNISAWSSVLRNKRTDVDRNITPIWSSGLKAEKEELIRAVHCQTLFTRNY